MQHTRTNGTQTITVAYTPRADGEEEESTRSRLDSAAAKLAESIDRQITEAMENEEFLAWFREHPPRRRVYIGLPFPHMGKRIRRARPQLATPSAADFDGVMALVRAEHPDAVFTIGEILQVLEECEGYVYYAAWRLRLRVKQRQFGPS